MPVTAGSRTRRWCGVDAGASCGVAADVGVEAGEEGVEGAFAVAGGEDDGVGGEAAAGALLGVFEVEFDAGAAAGAAACGADADAGGEGGVGPAAVEGASVELVVDGGDGVGVDALVELPLLGDEGVAYVFGEGVEVVGVVGGEVFEAEFGVLHGGEGLGAGEPVDLLDAGGRARRRSRKISAPDWPEPMTVMWSAARSRSRWWR